MSPVEEHLQLTLFWNVRPPQSAGKGKVGRREWEIPETASAEQPLRLGQYERTQQQLQKERQEDYKKMLQVKFHFDPDKKQTFMKKKTNKQKNK